MANQPIDLRRYNIKDVEDALQFLDLFESKLPQIRKVLKGNKLKIQSLINRAEFAENRKEKASPEFDDGVERSVADRITGSTSKPTPPKALSRVDQLRRAQNPEVAPPTAPATEPAPVMVTEPEDDFAPAAPGEIGQLDMPNLAPRDKVRTADADEALATVGGPVDLAAIAAAQDEEEVAAEAGTSPSEHTANDDVQQEDQEPAVPAVEKYSIKEDDQVFTQFHVDNDLFQHILSEDEESNVVNHYLKNGLHISVQDFEAAEKVTTDFAANDTVGVGDRIAREQAKEQA